MPMTTILVIEDEAYVREILCDMLAAEAFEVMAADNGQRGLELARDTQPDLILCDIMMPELDGYGVLAQLNTDPNTEDIPFVFLSAKADRIDFRAGMDLGADDYLTKPFTRDELLGAVQTRLNKRAKIHKRYVAKLRQAQTQYKAQLRQAERKLNHLLSHDSLTALPNRLGLRERFEDIIAQSNSKAETLLVPVACLSIDRFRRINQELGYEAGDRCLQMVAQRLKAALSDYPGAVLARLGGDTFTVIYPPQLRRYTIEQQMETVCQKLAEPYDLDGREVFLTVSVGLAFYPRDAEHLDTILLHSQRALGQARQEGGNHVKVYSAALALTENDEITLETDLRYALDRNEFALHYQPQVDLNTGQIVGAEALLRWHHPVRGTVSPARFIPLAEESEAIVEIGEWVLRTVCNQCNHWRAEGLPQLRIAANLSGRQFDRPDLRERLEQLLRELNFDPRTLELELTETILVRNPDASVRILAGLKALGMTVAIDDFGTGYSSLGYLQQFPFDVLKIDRCFVMGIDRRPKNAAITQAIVKMGRQLGLCAVAEGIETISELQHLRELGCNRGQGYLFSPPLPALEFAELLRDNKPFPIL